jgi:molecular chaperone DnaK
VTIRVFQGEREQAAANKFLGQFDLSDIPPAARGVPQIEVAFDIDANGILSVSAKDMATAKEQKIVIKASSGLSEEEVKQMVKDAEAHAEEDRKFHELASARNHGDSMIHATEKSLKDLGDKVSVEEKSSIEHAVTVLKEALKENNKEDIEAKIEALTAVSGKLAESSGGTAHEGSHSEKENKENVVDAEFEEIKENKH